MKILRGMQCSVCDVTAIYPLISHWIGIDILIRLHHIAIAAMTLSTRSLHSQMQWNLLIGYLSVGLLHRTPQHTIAMFAEIFDVSSRLFSLYF